MKRNSWLNGLSRRLGTIVSSKRQPRRRQQDVAVAAMVEFLETRQLMSAQAVAAAPTVDSTSTVNPYTVTNTNDGGTGSLRQAIENANAATTGSVTITFAIAGSGVEVIEPLSALPTITRPVTIDGTTQSGYISTPLIELDGVDAGKSNGLTISAGDTTIRGLCINQFESAGISLVGNGKGAGGENVLENDFIGVDPTGTVGLGNGTAGVLVTSSTNNKIGEVSAGNLISGSKGYGVDVQSSSGNLIQGNYIGTDLTGTNAVGNAKNGVLLNNSSGNLIGGESSSVTNSFSGIGSAIGNLISGNGTSTTRVSGIDVIGATATGNRIAGNFIGTDATGTKGLGNTGDGMALYSGATQNAIGTSGVGADDASQRNVISGNGGDGIEVGDTNGDVATNGNRIYGNEIGTDVTGTKAIGNSDAGIELNYANQNIIGNAPIGVTTQNIVAGNGTQEIELTTHDSNNLIEENRVGGGLNGMIVDPVTSTASFSGIIMWGASDSNLVTGNVISHISRAGVYVDSSTGDTIERNSIYANDQSSLESPVDGILLLGSNPNHNQAAPVLKTAFASGISTIVGGTLTGTANPEYRIEVYLNNLNDVVKHSVSYIEGQQFVGYLNFATGSTGSGTWTVTLPTLLPEGEYVTVTATNLTTGDTSKFSSALIVSAPNHAPQGTNNTVTTAENTPLTIATADFGFSDPNDTPPNTFLAVEITTLPTQGTLTDNGVAVKAGQFVSASDVTNSKLVFTPAANATGVDYASFTFQVEDNGGTANGGVNLDPTPNTLTINVS